MFLSVSGVKSGAQTLVLAMSCGAVLLLNGDLRGQEKATVSVPRLVSRSVMNFSELAAQEARRPVLPRPWRATRQIEEAPPQQVPPSAVRPLAQAPTLGTSPGASVLSRQCGSHARASG